MKTCIVLAYSLSYGVDDVNVKLVKFHCSI